MGGFMLANLLAVLAADYALLVARLLLALSAATFMPAASGYAAGLGGAQRHGRALSMITGELTLAIVAGAPLGVLVNGGFGWRATFLGVAGAGGALAARHPHLAVAPAACRPPKG
jgi:predicted MFS family arabinose efflux permease